MIAIALALLCRCEQQAVSDPFGRREDTALRLEDAAAAVAAAAVADAAAVASSAATCTAYRTQEGCYGGGLDEWGADDDYGGFAPPRRPGWETANFSAAPWLFGGGGSSSDGSVGRGAAAAAAAAAATFAIIGDAGLASAGCEARVAGLLRRFEVVAAPLSTHLAAVLSVGDQAYWDGTCSDHRNVLRFYGRFLGAGGGGLAACQEWESHAWGAELRDELGALTAAAKAEAAKAGAAARAPRFWPAIGNHDWDVWAKRHGAHLAATGTRGSTGQEQQQQQQQQQQEERRLQTLPHLQVFDHLGTLASAGPSRASLRHRRGEWYRRVIVPGLIEVFCLNSNLRPLPPPTSVAPAPAAGGEAGSAGRARRVLEAALHAEMRAWLRRALRGSSARWRVVFFHHPPFSTAVHDAPATWMRWPFRAWGADLVVSGHQHCYERVRRGGLTYVVNGLGGHSWIYDNMECPPVGGSQARFNSRHGAMLLRANDTALRGAFFDVEGRLVDDFAVRAAPRADDAQGDA
jgi:hypothetical protein